MTRGRLFSFFALAAVLGLACVSARAQAGPQSSNSGTSQPTSSSSRLDKRASASGILFGERTRKARGRYSADFTAGRD